MVSASLRVLFVALIGLCGCGYFYYAEPISPVQGQALPLDVHDDGSILFTQGRFEVRVRPMTDEELNRRFESMSSDGRKSTNPYTFGNADRPVQESEGRFTVFFLSVKNYEYPKILIDPARISLEASNGRDYWALDLQQLSSYYRAYALGFGGNEYARLRERTDMLNRTMYQKEMLFSGQETEGYLVFPSLHPDVTELTMTIHDAITRFDYRDEPVESMDISYRFEREVGRIYRDGTRRRTASSAD
jgi:hypothetical protein